MAPPPERSTDADAAANVALVIELTEYVQRMNRAYLRERHPDATEAEVEALFVQHILESHDNEFASPEYRRIPGWPRRK